MKVHKNTVNPEQHRLKPALTSKFFSINTVNLFFLLRDFLNDVFFSLVYCKNGIYDIYI